MPNSTPGRTGAPDARDGASVRVRFGLARKITLLGALVLFVVAAATVWMIQRHMVGALRKEFEAKARAITYSFAAAGQALLNGEGLAVESLVYDFRKVPGVAYVVVVDPSQAGVLLHTFRPRVPDEVLETLRLANPSVETVRDLVVPGAGRVIDVAAPVFVGDSPGTIHVGLAYAPIDAAVRALVLRTLAVFGGGLLLSMVLTALLARVVVRPVTALVTAAQAIGRGDLRVRPAVSTRDEMALLSAGLGEMTDQLAGAIGRIAGSADALGTASARIHESLAAVVQGSESQVRLTEQTAVAMAQVGGSVESVKGSVERLLDSTRTSAEAVAALSTRTDQVAAAAQELHAAAEETSSSAVQIAAAIATLSEGASAFAAIVDETRAAVTAMDRSAGAVAERARETAEAAARSAVDAGNGRGAVSSLAAHLGESREVGRQAASAITELQREMAEISGVLAFIDGVADQTSLLALNAAIIAAQAGEHGRGFAVVSTEIKALAERTATSVAQIGQVIERVQAKAAGTVEAVLTSARRMEEGATVARQALAALDQIQTSSAESGLRVQAIVSASDEHAQGREAIRGSMSRLASVAAGMSKATGEQRVGSERLREVAERLRGIAQAMSQATAAQAGQGREIASAMQSVAAMVQDISGATGLEEQQVHGVVRAASEIDAIARTNRASVGRLEGVADELQRRAEDLTAAVRRFER